MIDQRHQLNSVKRNRLTKSAVAVATAAALFATVPGFLMPARAWDDRACSITVEVPEGTFSEIDQANVVLDFYRIADASPLDGFDAYHLAVNSKYGEYSESGSTGIAKAFEDAGIELNIRIEDISEADAYGRKIGQVSATYIMEQNGIPEDDGIGPDDDTPITPVGQKYEPELTVKLGEKAQFSQGGMYLAIAHGVNVEDYKKTIEPEEGETESSIGSVAFSSSNVYTFYPMLFTVPTKEAAEGQVVTTDLPGEWINDVKANVKAKEDVRFGRLKITKKLDNIEQKAGRPLDPVTCVFRAIGIKDNKEVFRKKVSITLEASGSTGQDSVILDNIPAGTVVTVTEIYSGAEYVSSDGGTVQVSRPIDVAEREIPEELLFNNRYDDKDRGAGSVTNHSKRSEDNTKWDPNFEQMDESPDMQPLQPADKTAEPEPAPAEIEK